MSKSLSIDLYLDKSLEKNEKNLFFNILFFKF
jgi:hypothetical protein